MDQQSERPPHSSMIPKATALLRLLEKAHGTSKVTLANLLMWTRDHLFQPSYAQATTTRLLPFFRLPGRILTLDDQVLVTLRPFNDRTLNHDLADFCQRVNQAHLSLPAGKTLIFRLADSTLPTSNLPP